MNCDLFVDSHNTINILKNYFCQLLNVHGFNSAKQREVHRVETLVPEHTSFEDEVTIEKMKRYKYPGIDQIPAELLQAEGKTLRSEIRKLNSIWNRRNCKISGRTVLLCLFIKRWIERCNYYSWLSIPPTTDNFFLKFNSICIQNY